MTPELLAQLRTAAGQIATELVFAEPGKDNGLLPINCLLMEIEGHAADQGFPGTLAAGLGAARATVDQLFASEGVFSADAIQTFANWIEWFEEALHAVAAGAAIEPFAVPAAPSPPAAPSAATHAAIAAGSDEALVLNLEQDKDLLQEFILESGEHLQNIEQGVLTLEAAPADPDTLNSIFRAFHTFKGGAGFLNLRPVHDLAHDLESLLDLARQHKLAIDRAVINVILEGGDLLKKFADAIGARLTGGAENGPILLITKPLRETIRRIISGEKGPAEEKSSSNAVRVAETSAPQSAPAARASSVKVDTQKLDGLMDAVGEMVVAQALVAQNPALGRISDGQLARNLSDLARITKELQRTAMSLRMIPIRSTFQKMHRVVRDIAAKVGKKVELATAGEDTELDRTIVEEISDPLIHMVRNSIDHGVELPSERLQRGKPEQGTISLRAYHQGGNIVIEVQDDGKGLDREAILAKAREKGLVKPDEELSDYEIFNLIFAPGFSTASQVTELSGRGVGMDVVRRNVDKLRGKIEIQSKPGEGSTFSVFLPLTLAIIDGLLVAVGNQRYILPTLTVSESFRPGPGAVKTVQARGEVVQVRGQLRPLVRLYQHLGVEPATTDPADSIVIVVQASNGARCVMVDKLLGKQEVVIKSLGETFRQNRCVAGAAILGDGHVGLILDSQALVHLGGSPGSARRSSSSNAH